MKTKKAQENVTRRSVLQLLAAYGITGPAALQIAAQAPKQVSPEILRTAGAFVDQKLDDARLSVVATALQRNLEQFQLVRDLDIDDMVEPALVFVSKVR